MSATTVNAFPPLHAFNSSRSWFLALIVLLHAGFFWVLTHGLTIGSVELAPPVIVDFLPDKPKNRPDPPKQPEPPQGVTKGVVDPVPLPPPVDYRDTPSDNAPQADPHAVPAPGPGSAVPMPPIVVEPAGDARFPFTEPEYPVSEIRLQHEGTVLLKVQILPNGRVGEVRIEKSSGYAKLDESAAREARRYRMKPGTQDGVATAMWVRVPITFQLKE
jgi:periplasmic protein TonB